MSRAIFHSHRTNAPGSRSQSKRSVMELELRTLRDRARRAIDPPTARAIVGYRASSSILVIHDSDLSELIDPLENSIMISICLLVHSIFVLRIRIHLLHGVAEKTDCTTRLFKMSRFERVFENKNIKYFLFAACNYGKKYGKKQGCCYCTVLNHIETKGQELLINFLGVL